MRFRRGQGHRCLGVRTERKEGGVEGGGGGVSGRRAVTWNECTAAALLPVLSLCTQSHLSSDALRPRECTNNEYIGATTRPKRIERSR